MKSLTPIKYQNALLLLLAFISGILLSPKWTITLAAWIHFTVLLRFYRDSHWKGYLVSIPLLALSAYFAQTGVLPFDTVTMLTFIIVATTIGLAPYLIDRLTYRLVPGWIGTLIFPTIFTLFNYFIEQGPQGTWGNMAYTQYSFLSLMQISSITGIYGINFLIYWFASTTNYLYERRTEGQKVPPAIWIMPAVLILSIGYGMVKLNETPLNQESVTVSTITMDNLEVGKSMYQAEFGKDIDIPKNVSQSDPILQEVYKGLIAFMKDPENPKYAQAYTAMDKLLDRYMKATREAAAEGARIITWSEGAVINIKTREEEYETQIAALADELDIYLFFATAVFHPEKVGVEDRFIENKVLTFDPEGQLLNSYFKNIPVFGVEPSFPGDGTIPVIETPYGNLSPIICYDADHPQLIQQVSDQATDMLVVPTGDWKAISPYHTYMAAVRCIENGVSMLKSTSNGLSAVIDHKGRILARHEYFDDAEVKKIVYDFRISSSDTMYASSYPMFLTLLKLMAVLLLVYIPVKFLFQKYLKRRESVDKGPVIQEVDKGIKVEA
jgi:apolipoprotein N-acyltransferase